MAAASLKQSKQRQTNHKRRAIYREMLGLVLLGIGLLVFFSLISYHPEDPSFNSLANNPVRNWIGPVGANLADITHQFFGLGAYCLAWIPVAFGVAVLIGRDLRHVVLRLFGFVALATATSALAEFVGHPRSGGLIGHVVVQRVALLIGQAGAAITLVVAFLVLAVASLDVSFVGITAWLSRGVHAALSWLASLAAGQWQAFSGAVADYWAERKKAKALARAEAVAASKAQAVAAAQATAPSKRPRKKKTDEIRPAETMSSANPSSPLDDEPEQMGDDIGAVAPESEGPGEFGSWPNMPEVLAKPNEEDWQAQPGQAEVVLRAAAGPIIVDPRPEEAPKKIAQKSFEFAETNGPFKLPPSGLLDYDAPERIPIDNELLLQNAKKLERKLRDYGIDGNVVEIRPGPVVTMYEFLPAAGVKVSKIASLSDDLAMAMSAMRVRIVAPIPGKGVVGIEIPNDSRETVYLKEIISHEGFLGDPSKLALAIGKDIEGKPYFTDLARCPHLLVAGATGSGKSVSINTIVLSLLYRATPEEVRLIMVDPKMLELSIYEGIPHLLLPVVTDPKKASLALRWAVEEMERRYALLSEAGVRNITGYNKKVEKLAAEGTPLAVAADGEVKAPAEKLPYIVVLIDELADLMMVASREVEISICRLAQMARAAGIHLILATQRPSVDVLTGVIKANFPARMSFQVASRHDSRTILDNIGAENLLGMGDMLLVPPGTGGVTRVHGAYVSEVEIHRVVEFLKKQGKPLYDESILRPRDDEGQEGGPVEDDYEDELYDQAVAVVSEQRQASVSMIQRRMRIGYNRAARLIERMEKEGVVGPGDGAKPRDVLVQPHV